jgi:pyridoxamine 5'-phosphate oxidase
MAIADLRREYRLSTLDRSDLAPDPIDQFQKWFGEAAGFGGARGGRLRKFAIALYKAFHGLITGNSIEPNAMALATADIGGHPSVRTVLLKGVDARGFTFFTNYQSRKGRELDANAWGALAFYWPHVERQVCVSGPVTQLSREESERYFRSRPLGSRLAAWASDQSAVIPDRAALEARWRQIEEQFQGKDIPLPPFWGGYLLSPHNIEFWQGRPSRLHDRFRYTRTGDKDWKLDRLAP